MTSVKACVVGSWERTVTVQAPSPTPSPARFGMKAWSDVLTICVHPSEPTVTVAVAAAEVVPP